MIAGHARFKIYTGVRNSNRQINIRINARGFAAIMEDAGFRSITHFRISDSSFQEKSEGPDKKKDANAPTVTTSTQARMPNT